MGADGEPTHVISVELADRLYPDMELLRLDSGELTGDVQKRVNGNLLQWRLPIRALDTLTILREMSFKGLFIDRAIFGGVGKGDSIPGSTVSSIYGCKPHVLYKKAFCSVGVVGEGSNYGRVVVIQGVGRGAPLCCHICMRLGKERKTRKFGAGGVEYFYMFGVVCHFTSCIYQNFYRYQ